MISTFFLLSAHTPSHFSLEHVSLLKYMRYLIPYPRIYARFRNLGEATNSISHKWRSKICG